jgi:hypothetical protein
MKLGGLLATSDVVNTSPLSPELQGDTALLCGCIAGAAMERSRPGWNMQALSRYGLHQSRKAVVSATVEARKPA